ncbi:hypothetical protein MAPG_04881 [Magnaporthiopsis poae ATCC 64411]|uniref:BZIP domain-containing protein n=1 Tax=Magnaporthiopsis poae (strain ATCC 64411 / 73-15) TaxID=644358 RepID=A0A0C4DXX4_MAGP6|nr:hypothetical protein MAPG_04881 [Magnaporthiopsis poae ATCC 64411]
MRPRFLPTAASLSVQGLENDAKQVAAGLRKLDAQFASDNGEVTIPCTADDAYAKAEDDRQAVAGAVAAVQEAKKGLQAKQHEHAEAEKELQEAEAQAAAAVPPDVVPGQGDKAAFFEELADLLRQHGDSHAEAAALKKELEESQAREQGYKKAAQNAQARERGLHDDLQDTQADRDGLLKSLQDARAHLEDAQTDKDGLSKSLRDAQAHLGEAQADKDRLLESLQDAQVQIEDARADKDELQKELQDAHAHLANTRATNIGLQKSLGDMQANTQQLEQDLKDAEKSKYGLWTSLTDMQARKKGMEERLADAQSREQALQKSLEDVQGRAQGLQQSLEEVQAHEQRLQEELRDAQARENGLQQSLRNAHAREEANDVAAENARACEAGLRKDLQDARACHVRMRKSLQDSHAREEANAVAAQNSRDREAELRKKLQEEQAHNAELQRDLQISRTAVERLDGDLMQAGIDAQDFAARIGALERLARAVGVDPSMKLGQIVDAPMIPRVRAPSSTVWKVSPAWLGSGVTVEFGVLESKEALIRLQVSVANNDLVSPKTLALLSPLTSAVATAPAIEAEALGKILEDASGRLDGASASAANSAAIYAWWQLAWLFTQGWEGQPGVNEVMAGHLISPFDTLSKASKGDRLWEAAQKLGHAFQHIVLPPIDVLHVVLVNAQTKTLRVVARSQMVTTIMEGTIVAPEGTDNMLVKLGPGNLAPWIKVVEARDLPVAPSA